MGSPLTETNPQAKNDKPSGEKMTRGGVGFHKHMFEGLLIQDFHCPPRIFLLSVTKNTITGDRILFIYIIFFLALS